MSLFRSFLVVLVVLLSQKVLSQSSTISGAVVGSDGTGVPFVTVSTGTTSTLTDANGGFTIASATADSTDLTVSGPGFATVTVRTAGAGAVQLTVQERVTDLPAFRTTSSITGGSGPSRNMPGSAWYIGPREIQRSGYTDPHRMLRSVPGVSIQEEDGFGLRPNIGLRGTGSERSSKITMMEDGVLMAPAPYASPAAYWFPSIARMHAVEVVKGSSQLRYGPLSTGGAINFISTPLPQRTAGKVALWGGSHGMLNLHAHAGTVQGPVAVLVESVQQSAEGFKELDNGGNTGFNKQDHMVKLRWKNADNARLPMALVVKAGLTKEESNETYLGLTTEDFAATPYRRYAGSAKDRMEVEHDLLSAQYVVRIPQGPQLALTAYRSNTYRNWYKLDQVKDSTGTKTSISSIVDDPVGHAIEYATLTGATSADDALQVKANNRNYQTSGVQLQITQDWKRERATHKIELGARLHNDYMDRYQWVDGYAMRDGDMMMTSSGTPGTESNRIASATAFAGHAVYDLTIGRIGIHPGLRMEHIEMHDENFGKQDPGRTSAALVVTSNTRDVWLPGISVDVKANPTLMAFAGVHKGFSPAGADPGTQPEESINYEAGVRWFPAGTEVQVIGFYNDYSQMLGADLSAAGGSGSGDLFNGGAAVVAGVEVFATKDPLHGRSDRLRLPIRVAYTFTDARFSSTFNSTFEPWGQVLEGDRIPFTPMHQLQAGASLEGRRFSIGIRAVCVGGTVTATGAQAENGSSGLPAYTTVDADVTYRLGTHAEVFSTVQNLFDAVYAVGDLPAGWRPGLPRTVQGGFRFRF